MANLSSTTDIASSSRPPPPLYVCEALDEDLKVPSIPGPDEVAAYKADRSFVRALREPLREEITSDLIKRRLQDLIDEGLACSEHLEGSEDVERVLRQLRTNVESMTNLITEFLVKCKAESPQHSSSASSSMPCYALVHELRVPLQNLFYFMSLSIEERSPSFYNELREGYRLLHQLLKDIPDDLLQGSQIRLQPAPFLLNQLCERVHCQIASYAQEHGVKVTFNFSPIIDHYLIGDIHRIGQILKNFISNAIKYSESPEINVVIEIHEDNVLFRVIDHGLGISRDHQQKLFQPFYQVREDEVCCCCLPRRRDKPSTVPSSGVGLFFCKKVAELMNDGRTGAIGVISDGMKGHGSEFWFTIPYRKGPLETPIPATPTSGHPEILGVEGLSILIADDTSIARKLYQRFLPKSKLLIFEDGDLAIDDFQRRAATGEYCDIAILDMQMTRMGGAETARRIQAIAKEHMPHIIFISGNSEEQVLEELRGFRLDMRKISILTKPIKRNELIATINQATASSSASGLAVR